ncbi:hypothetical protein H7972_26360, partial [Pseudomonas aeruginosa]|nr:hypothetical protein [Pseudomonas aeruginosa]
FDLGSDGHQFDLLMTPAVSRAERSSGQASNYFRPVRRLHRLRLRPGQRRLADQRRAGGQRAAGRGGHFQPYPRPADRSTRALFGDGAGAVVLRAGDAEEEGALQAFDLGSDGHQFDLLMTPAVSRAERSSGQASNYFRMDGKAVFGQAVTQMSDSVRRVLDRVGWQASDLHHLVPHQANTRILAAVADQLDLPVERVVSNIAEVGNTVAASIPLALAHGLRQGILHDGGNMVLTGFGAGLTWGSVALRWPKIVPTMD